MPSAIVVGAGVFGASLADRLAGDGWEVLLIDRDQPGHGRAESGGESRLLRFSHGDDAWYTRSARRALELWRELDPRLVVQSGIVWFARREHGWEADSERVLRAEGVVVERLAPEDAATLFPSLGTHDLAFALHEPEAGILRARDATRALVERAVGRGAGFELSEAQPDGAAVLLADGRRLEAEVVVWACGAWLARLFPALVPLRITQQDLFFFEAPPEWSTPPLPGFVDYDGAAYGLGALDGYGVKVASDVEGPDFDPDTWPRVPNNDAATRSRDLLRLRFPALGDAPLQRIATCQYSLTPDTHFIAAPHPEHDNVWLLGGGSGHGFKHGPALAEQMAGWVTNDGGPEPRFGLGPRDPDRSLRTAGG
jgi:sarcosine oxidase